ncbi:MAG: hypothetical protein WBB17_02020 [Saprospiraceae bacterium]|nr:hypothetical protein [Saprospiraceae bacterium]
MKYILFAIGLLTFTFQSCAPSTKIVNKKDIDPNWIIGKWKRIDKDMYEKWSKISDMEYVGVAYDMSSGLVEIEENLKIYKMENKWIYEVKHKMNEFKAVPFVWTPAPGANLRFVNQANDFPQVVTYIQNPNGNLTAKISSLDDTKKEYFEFNKVFNK